VQAKLVVVGGETNAREFDIELPAIIGRSRNTDVTVGHPLVSRQHCEVFEADGLLLLRDLGSLNGTYVGQTRLAEQPMPIQPGEQFTVGPVTFRAEYQARGGRLPSSPWEAANPTLDAPLNAAGKKADNSKRPR
jgi:pSer/pThr/pTyr-binding forkhead associated (FHA) protein